MSSFIRQGKQLGECIKTMHYSCNWSIILIAFNQRNIAITWQQNTRQGDHARQ